MSFIRLALIMLGAITLSACNLTVNNNFGGTVQKDSSASSCATAESDIYPNYLHTECFVYNYNQQVALTAVPDTGYHFVEWRGACKGNGNCSVSLGSNQSVTAVFSPDNQSFNVTSAFTDQRGVLYLFDASSDKVYRWQTNDQFYLPPIDLGADATLATFSETNRRLYVAYSDNSIKQFYYISESPAAQNFASTVATPQGLTATGPAVFTIDQNGAESLFDSQGQLQDSHSSFELSTEYIWNPQNSRLYYFRDHTSPNDIYYQEINTTDMTFGASTDSPYHGDYSIQHPIRVSADGKLVLTGSGDIYNADDLTLAESLPITVTDAVWSQQALLTLRGSTNTTLEQWDSNLKRTNLMVYSGAPVRILASGSDYLVITRLGGELQFHPYHYNLDADNDGVPTAEDAFPLDPAASVDTDHDGYPDQWNDGKSAADSTTGLTLDAFPQDSACHLASQGINGVCNIAAQIPDYVPEKVMQGNGNISYLFDKETQRIYRWNDDDNSPLNPIVLGGDINHVAYDPATDQIFTGADTGAISRIDPATLTTTALATTPQANGGLAVVGNYLLVEDASGAWVTHYVFTKQGKLTDSADWNYYSRVYTWDPVTSRVYFFRDDTSPNDLQYEVIDQSTGKISDSGETPYHGAYNIQPPIRVSTDGHNVLLGSGDIYESPDLTWGRSLGNHPVDAIWNNDGSLIVLVANGNNTELRQYAADFSLYNIQEYTGAPVAIEPAGDHFTIVTDSGKPQFFTYVPTDDGDHDGVPTSQDAFPLDPAASVDTDGDGYPDQWNSGYSQSDSTTGLVLDAFPQDSACQTASQGNNGVCDIAAQIPNYAPEKVMQGNDGTIYLFDSNAARIYRWSSTTHTALDPILLRNGVSHVAYDAATNQLFAGYSSGIISSISPATGKEKDIAATAEAANGIAVVGNYLLAQDGSGAWATHYIFSKQGALIQTKDWNYYSRVYTWDPVTSRVYFFRDDTSPDDLQYEQIDQSTGTISNSGETPYHGDYLIMPPIRVSNDGHYILLGSGDIYESTGLAWVRSLGIQPIDAIWNSDGGLIVLIANGSDTELRQYGTDFTLYNTQQFSGSPVAIEHDGSAFTVVTESGQPQFYTYTPTNDADNDGVPNNQDAFPLDPAASVDSDGDGYPDQWNPGYTQADSTTGLVLDSFPQDMGCQTADQGINGQCDFKQILPSSITADFCSTDDISALASGGTTQLDYPVSDMIPLCSGWVIVADTHGDAVRIIHMGDNRTGAIYQLQSAPNLLRLDTVNKTLYASTSATGQIAKIDLLSNGIQYLSLSQGATITSLTNGPDNSLLVLAGGTLTAVSKSTLNVLGSWPINGSLLVYNSDRHEVITTYGIVYRYSFDLSTGPTLLESNFNLGSNVQDLDLSPDNQHLTVASGGGNGNGYTIFDIDPSNLTTSRGEWATGAYPQSTAFSLSSDILVSKNFDSMLIFSVADYSLLDSVSISSNCKQVEDSRGNRIAFALSGDSYYNPKKSNIQWLIYQ